MAHQQNDKDAGLLEGIVDFGIHLAKIYIFMTVFCWAFMFITAIAAFFAIFVFKVI